MSLCVSHGHSSSRDTATVRSMRIDSVPAAAEVSSDMGVSQHTSSGSRSNSAKPCRTPLTCSSTACVPG
ncbi:hypothetical protein ACFPRL_03400 [Pseudoclavibacter helvolus]